MGENTKIDIEKCKISLLSHTLTHIVIIKLINIYVVFWAIQGNSLIVLFCILRFIGYLCVVF